MKTNRIIYLDNAATTACSEASAQAVMEALTKQYGNPSSLHGMGLEAEKMLRAARERVAKLAGCREEEILFTSGATEGNNLALSGAAEARKRRGNRIVSDPLEHPSVKEALQALHGQGFVTADAAPDPDGRIPAEAAAGLVDEKTILLSVMLVNNETGTVNDIAALCRLARAKNPDILIHCDAVQALGKIPVNVGKLGVDLATFSAHKLHGPKGIGAVYLRKGVRILPELFGGGQQNGLRPGTENTPGAAGFGVACQEALEQLEDRYRIVSERNRQLRERLSGIPGAGILSPADASPYILSAAFPGMRGETLLHFLEARGVYVSSGSACSKGKRSPVLTAMGVAPTLADGALRFSFSEEITEADIAFTADCLEEALRTLVRGK